MPLITLPDGSQRQFDQAVTVFDVASDIGPGLAKATLAGEVDGHLDDASFELAGDSTLRIITAKDEEGLEIIRHSSMTYHMKELNSSLVFFIGSILLITVRLSTTYSN